MRSLPFLALLAAFAIPTAASNVACEPSRPTAPVRLDPGIAAFYAAHGSRPLWIAGGRLRPEAESLLGALAFAGRNGLDPSRYRADSIRAEAEKGRRGDKAGFARAELLLSQGLARYVADLHQIRGSGMLYVERGLEPQPGDARGLLEGAAAAPSLLDYLRGALAMNPLYETLRAAYGQQARRLSSEARRVVERNLLRLRAIPADSGARWILVDAGGARLWMMEGRRVAGSMPVIVGKPNMQTPVMAARLRYAILNPYWNLPPDLVRDRAKRVLREGQRFLSAERLQILSDWGPSPRPLSASRVDWAAVASGRQDLRMRQLPGGANVMGKIKFMMPNGLGIYLHDFPDKSLFARADRHLSSGCIRLSDAPMLAHWLFDGRPPQSRGQAPEQEVALPTPVPVYVVYLTAFPSEDGVAMRPDVYARDRSRAAPLVVQQDRADRSPAPRPPR